MVALATASTDATGVTLSPSHSQQRPSNPTGSSISDTNEWQQDIRDLLTLTSITGSKPIGSGSSDPGSPSSIAAGVRDKKPSTGSIGSSGSAGNSHRLPRFLNSSVKGEKTSGGQLRLAGNVVKTSPVQIQLHLLASNNNADSGNGNSNNNTAHQRPRRHSLER